MDSMVATQASTPQPKFELRSRHSTFDSLDEGGIDSGDGSGVNAATDKKYAELKTERDKLARELERERRDRYAEARMHLQYMNQLRKELQRTQEQLKSRTNLFEHELSKIQGTNKGTLRAILNAVWYTIFPDAARLDNQLLLEEPTFSSPSPAGGEFPNAPDIAKQDEVVEEAIV